jgi:Putative peptidoglycan binding domain.
VDPERRYADSGGGGGGRTYVRDPKGSDTGGQFTANPAPVTGTYQGYKAGRTGPGGLTGRPRRSAAAKAAPKAGLPASSKFKTLAPGEQNDPAAVGELQKLLAALGIPIGFSGVYDDATVEAVKAVQRKLGIKNPNGRANRGLVNKLLNAYDLSPCLNPGT